jgi:hypothetical protein
VLELQHPTKSYKQVGQLRFKVSRWGASCGTVAGGVWWWCWWVGLVVPLLAVAAVSARNLFPLCTCAFAARVFYDPNPRVQDRLRKQTPTLATYTIACDSPTLDWVLLSRCRCC